MKDSGGRFALRWDGSLIREVGRGGTLPHADRIETAGLRSFALKPNLPSGWKGVRLKRLHAAGGVCDLEVSPGKIMVRGRGFRVAPRPDGFWEVRR